jgi:hypothetical protein
MIFFSIGLPTRFAAWCDALTTQLVARALGASEALAANTAEELAAGLIRTRASHVVVCARRPSNALQSEISQSGQPFLVALGDPRAALRQLRDVASLNIADATRAVASSCAMMGKLIAAPNALVVSESQAGDQERLARTIAGHLGFELGIKDVSEVLAGLAAAGLTPDSDTHGGWQEGLDERAQTILNGALRPYLAHLTTGADLEPLIWEPELFYVSEEPPAPVPVPATGPIEITGRIRFLVYGPFIMLPRGAWSADVILGFSAEAAGLSFVVEVFAGSQLAHARIEVAGEQVSETRLYFTIDDSVGQPVQIRIMNERAAFDGRLAVGYVAITPQAIIPEETRERLTNTLRR